MDSQNIENISNRDNVQKEENRELSRGTLRGGRERGRGGRGTVRGGLRNNETERSSIF